MYEHDKKTGAVSRKTDGSPKAKTSHSLNPVPCVIYDPRCQDEYPHQAGEGSLNEGCHHEGSLRDGIGISSIAATCIRLLGYLPPADYDRALIK
jgi:2,3-bisphosphoglycerate-independent phosphoglycerate mutase